MRCSVLVASALGGAAACGSQPAAVTPVAPQAAAAAGAVPKQPLATLFGQVIDNTYQRRSRFELSEDTTYGWRIKLPCRGPTLFREVLQLPDAGDWSFDPATARHVKLSGDRRRAITVDYSGCYDGWIQHAWTIAAGDPPGEYVLTVEVDGYAPQTFRGRFVRPPEGGLGARRRP